MSDDARYWHEAYKALEGVVGAKMARITELEAQLAQRWQPIDDSSVFMLDDDLQIACGDHTGSDVLAVGRLCQDGITRGERLHLPADIRLCRLVTQEDRP